MKWCCAAFEGSYSEAGLRGLAIIIERDTNGEPRFILQYRAVDKDTELPLGLKVPVTLVCDSRIQYCPWCGRKLSNWYKKYIDELIRPGFTISII